MARSWLNVGHQIDLLDAVVGHDVAVLSRGTNPALGHVGFYSGHNESEIYILGGNQSDSVDVSGYDIDRLLGIRRVRYDER